MIPGPALVDLPLDGGRNGFHGLASPFRAQDVHQLLFELVHPNDYVAKFPLQSFGWALEGFLRDFHHVIRSADGALSLLVDNIGDANIAGPLRRLS
jgi:hypothetical protein